MKLKKLCSDDTATVDNGQIFSWSHQFKNSALLTTYVVMLKGCIGCVQMAQITDIHLKLDVIFKQGNLQKFAKTRKIVFAFMLLAMLCSLPIVIVSSRDFNQAFAQFMSGDITPLNIRNKFDTFVTSYRNGFETFGLMSGVYFMLIAFAMLYMFSRLFNQIE